MSEEEAERDNVGEASGFSSSPFKATIGRGIGWTQYEQKKMNKYLKPYASLDLSPWSSYTGNLYQTLPVSISYSVYPETASKYTDSSTSDSPACSENLSLPLMDRLVILAFD